MRIDDGVAGVTVLLNGALSEEVRVHVDILHTGLDGLLQLTLQFIDDIHVKIGLLGANFAPFT